MEEQIEINDNLTEAIRKKLPADGRWYVPAFLKTKDGELIGIRIRPLDDFVHQQDD